MLFARLPVGEEESAKFALVAESLSCTHHRLLDLVEIAVFGAQKSAGDEALRAIRMALAVRAAIPGSRLAVSTGRALSGPGELSKDAIDRGAHVVDTAIADAIELDETTARLIGDKFIVEAPPAPASRDGAAHERDTPDLAGPPTSCVGREQELDLLARLYGEVARGSRSRVALVLGPGGIGKSRLSQELLRKLGREGGGPRILRARPSSLGETTPLGVVGAMLRDIGRIRIDDGVSVREAKLRTTVREGEQARLVPLLTELASLGQTEA